MDHKAWPWKKKAAEKAVVETDKANNLSSKGNGEEIEKLVADKIELEKHLKSLNDKLSSVLVECNAKDELMKKHENEADEALSGWEKTKAEAASLKRKLDEALNEKRVSDERSGHLDAVLKECTQQLHFVREDQERRIHDALTKTSNEYKKEKIALEEKLADTSKRLTEADGENSRLSKALLAQNKIIEDLNRQRSQVEADFNALTSRLESKEKENASLKYEVRVLEKELEIRNEEREFNRRTAEASHKLHLENVKKIAKLEAECQRLRLLVRKRLPGPAALAKMKNEVAMLGRDLPELRRRRFNASPNGTMIDSERINNLTEQLCLMEEENRTLREALNKKVNELQFSRNMYSRTASRLLEFESHLEESSKGQTNVEASRSSNVSHEVSVVSVSEFDIDDKVSCADSWASALLSELENFKEKKQKGTSLPRTPEASEMILMDDFAEMEKLAVVPVDNPPCGSPVRSFDSITATGPVENGSKGNSSEVRGMEIVPLTSYSSNSSLSTQEAKSDSINTFPRWLQVVLKVIREHKRIAQRNADEIVEDIRKALSSISHSSSSYPVDVRMDTNHQETLNLSLVISQVSAKPSEISVLEDTPRRETFKDSSFSEKGNRNGHYDISKSICKIIDLIEGVSLHSPAYNIPEISSSKEGRHQPYRISETHSGYTVRVLQWKTSELSGVLQRFLHTCYDLLNRKADIKKFAEELSSALDWIVNHCFSLQDVSSMREEIRKQFDWDESRSESEAEVGIFGQVSEADRDTLGDKEAERKNSEGRISSVTDKCEITVHELEESDKRILNLQKELETLRKSMGEIEDRAENPKLSSKSVQESEAGCLILQHETASVSEKEPPKDEVKLDEKQPIRTEREITAASEKLAECQEAILNLGKQLKALSDSKEAALLPDKIILDPTRKSNTPDVTTTVKPASKTTPEKRLTSQRSSLLDQMKADDDAEELSKDQKPRGNKKGKEGGVSSTFIYNETIEALEHILLSETGKGGEANSYAIVPQKKDRGIKGLWKKLLWRKKRGNSKKLPVPFSS